MAKEEKGLLRTVAEQAGKSALMVTPGASTISMFNKAKEEGFLNGDFFNPKYNGESVFSPTTSSLLKQIGTTIIPGLGAGLIANDVVNYDEFLERNQNYLDEKDPLLGTTYIPKILTSRTIAKLDEINFKKTMNLRNIFYGSLIKDNLKDFFEDGNTPQIGEWSGENETAKNERRKLVEMQQEQASEMLAGYKDITNYASKEASFFENNILGFFGDNFVKSILPSDFEDLLSVARVSSWVYGGQITNAIGKGTVGATAYGIKGLGLGAKTAKGVQVGAGALGLGGVQAGLDVAQEYISNDVDPTWDSFGEKVRYNTMGNLASWGIGYFLGKGSKAIKEGFKNHKSGMAGKMAGAGTTPGPTPGSGGTTAGGTASTGATMSSSVESSIDAFTGPGQGYKVATVNGAYAGKMGIDPFPGTPMFGGGVATNSMMFDVNSSTPIERAAAKEAVEKYKADNGIKNTGPRENIRILGRPDVTETYRELVQNKRNQALTDTQMALFTSARTKATAVGEALRVDPTKRPNSFYFDGDTQSKFVSDVIQIGFENARNNSTDLINKSISAFGSDIGINDYPDFVQYSSDNAIDIAKAFYNRKIGIDTPPEFQRTFGYLLGLHDKYVSKTIPGELFGENDNIFKYASLKEIDNIIFETVDYTPAGWDFKGSGAPMRIRPGISSDDVARYLNIPTPGSVRAEGLKEVTSDNLSNILKGNLNLDDATKEKYKEIIKNNFDGTKKQLKAELKNAGLKNKDVNTVLQGIDDAKKLAMGDDDARSLISAIGKEYRYLNSRQSKIWQYFSKKNVLENEAGIFSRINGDGDFTSIKKALPLDEALESMTEAEQARLTEILGNVNKAFGKVDPFLERQFNGYEVPFDNGTSRVYDMRKTSVETLFNQKYGKEAWNKLDLQQKMNYINKDLGYKLFSNQITKIGQKMEYDFGTDDIMSIANTYLDNWGVSGRTNLRLNQGAKTFEAYASTAINGDVKNYNVVLDFTPEMTPHEKLGVLRHELQHVYESEFTDKIFDATFKDSFRNNPGIIDEDFITRIAENKPVSLREILGKFYNNHFYNYAGDNFETSLLADTMRAHYNSLTEYEKFVDFLSMVDRSRQVVSRGKTTVKDIFNFGPNANPVPEFMSEIVDSEIPEDFLFKTFKGENEMVDFIADLSGGLGQKGAQQNLAIYNNMINQMSYESVGFSPNQLIRSLNTNELKKTLNSKSIDTGDLSTDTQEIINTYRKQLSDAYSGRTEYNATVSAKRFAQNALTSTLIGNRIFKDAFINEMQMGLGYVFNGETGVGLKKMWERFPTVYKYIAQSASFQLGNVADQVGTIIEYATNDLMGINFEARALAHMSDTLKQWGNIGNKNFSLERINNLTETIVKMNLLREGIPLNTAKGTATMVQAKQMMGLKTNDTVSAMVGKGGAQDEFLSMLDKTSYSQLSPLQKKMYTFSGRPIEQYSEWVEYAKNAYTKINFDNIPPEFASVRNVINAGTSELDLVGFSRRTGKGVGKYGYLLQTAVNIMEASVNKTFTNVDTGVYMGKDYLNPNNLAKLLGAALMVASGLLVAYPGNVLYRSIKERRNFLNVIQEDMKNFLADPLKGSVTIAKELIEQSPIGAFGKGISSPLTTGANVFKQRVYNYEKGEFKGVGSSLAYFSSAIFGATYYKLLKDFGAFDKPKEQSFKIQNSKPFKKALEKETAKNVRKYMPGMYVQVKSQYKRELENDEAYYNFTNQN